MSARCPQSATFAFDDPHLRVQKWSAFPGLRALKLATVMLWGLELDRRLRAAGSPVTAS